MNNWSVPIYQPGKEPLPPGLTEEDRPALMQQKKVENWMRMASESCAFKTVLSGGAGKFLLFVQIKLLFTSSWI
jgi:import inner membrane translocase subunit TIM22